MGWESSASVLSGGTYCREIVRFSAKARSIGGPRTDRRVGFRSDSGGAAVAVVQAADHRFGDDLALVGRLDFARHGCVSVQRLMGSRFVVIAQAIRHDAAQLALAAQRASEALDERFAPATAAQRFLRISETEWNFCDVLVSKPIATAEGTGMHDCRAGRMRKLDQAER
jgi:hypothetical protein